MIKPYKTLSSKNVFKSKFIEIKKDEFIAPNGNKGEYYYMTDESQRVHAIGLDNENNFILTKQYRYPIKTVVIDVAGGVPEQDESIKKAAEREFFEETGYKGQQIIALGKCSIEQAKADYWLFEYLITDCSKAGKIHGGEKVEETEVFKLPVNKAWNYIKNNKIVSCHSISTITKALLYLQTK